jgi:hypothetical protein
MVNDAKITLSPQELQLVCDTEWILTKRIIIEKVYHLFGELAVSFSGIVEKNRHHLPEAMLGTEPKISKGENYLQLPYVVLDYPRAYHKTNSMAIRTMFWWGNFFSITLHVSGQYKNELQQSLVQRLPLLQEQEWFICINNEQWKHHFESDNYISLNEKSEAEIESIVKQQPFIKVAAKFSLQQWNEMPLLLEEMFNTMIQLLRH